MKIIGLLIFFFDGCFIGMLMFYTIGLVIGDKPFARLIKLLLGVASGIAYSLLCFSINSYVIQVHDVIAFIVLLGPILISIVLWVVAFMYKGNK